MRVVVLNVVPDVAAGDFAEDKTEDTDADIALFIVEMDVPLFVVDVESSDVSCTLFGALVLERGTIKGVVEEPVLLVDTERATTVAVELAVFIAVGPVMAALPKLDVIEGEEEGTLVDGNIVVPDVEVVPILSTIGEDEQE